MTARGRILVAVLLSLTAAAVMPAAAWADGVAVIVPSSGIDWALGNITASAEYPAGTASVVFTENGLTFATISVADTTLAGTVSSDWAITLNAKTVFTVEAFDATSASLGLGSLTLSPSMYRPGTPKLNLPAGSFVDRKFRLKASSAHTVTSVTVETTPEPMTAPAKLLKGSGGNIVVSDMRVPYGIEKLSITVANGFGSSKASKAKIVYSLGNRDKLPRGKRYELVDKRSMELYDVKHQHVLRHYDIAVGTPATPTPNGSFKIGAPIPSWGDWGPMRRPLYRFSGKHLYPTGFYIHGTNKPWSIGTWASHGRVRMYNWEIRLFTRTVPTGTLVRIRP